MTLFFIVVLLLILNRELFDEKSKASEAEGKAHGKYQKKSRDSVNGEQSLDRAHAATGHHSYVTHHRDLGVLISVVLALPALSFDRTSAALYTIPTVTALIIVMSINHENRPVGGVNSEWIVLVSSSPHSFASGRLFSGELCADTIRYYAVFATIRCA